MWLPIRIDEQRPEPLYHQIEVQLRGLILNGQLVEGTLLPSIRELAVSLKCSAITVRRVYQDLENEGLIRTRQGTGTFVARVELIARDEHRLERVTEKLEHIVNEALELQCKLEEIKTIFNEIILRKEKEQKGEQP